jgi:ADP-ribosylation factor GTPase-activating protein 1
MLDETYAHPDLNEIMSREGNTTCFDCGNENPKWASLNNGIILCLKCAGIHRSFGLQISIIRSVQVDSWNEKQVKYLSLGGNNKLKSFLSEYKIEPSSSFELKYKSKAAEYYRCMLKNEVEKLFDEKYKLTEMEKPNLEEGVQIIEMKQNDKEINNNFYIGSDNQNQKQTEESFFGAMGSFFKDFTSYAKDAVDTISKNINEVKFADTVIGAGNAMLDFAKAGGEYMINKTKEAANSDLVKNITKGAESGFNSIVEKSKILLNLDQQEINPNSQQNPGIDAYNNKINLANNQLNPTNSVENNENISNNKETENVKNINMMAEEIKNENKIEDDNKK